jgi:hypothetical protein
MQKAAAKKIQVFVRSQKRESNLQDAISSRKKLPQKNFRLFRHEKT